ncbi:MAG: sodium:solute symporter [Alphaproteobacteria bacterium]|nr:sodium:solute symporter [Alphaproteobacteria bacterium]
MTPRAHFAPIDVAIVVAYLLGIVLFGLVLSRRKASSEDFFLASRNSSWPIIGLALLASNISSTTLVGLAGQTYATGISVYDYEWTAGVTLAFFCVFFLPFLLRARLYTMPEFLERRYNRFCRTYFSGLTLFLNIVVDTASALYGGSLLLSLIFPHTPLSLIVAVMAVFAGVYTIAGGLKAVIYTEVVQAILLFGASTVISLAAFHKAGGWGSVMSRVDPAKLSLIRPLGDPGVPWLGLLTGVPLLGFYFWCTNQFMVQRILSAKDENHGRWGALFAGFLKLPVLFLMVLPGAAALLIYPRLPRADLVYPTLMFDLLPTGLLGLAVAGFLAALMSSIASTFNSASTLFTMDFVRPWRSDLSSRALVRIGRGATFTFGLLAVLWAPQIQHFASLWQYLQAILAYVAPPVVALYLVGVFWPRANGQGATAALLVGLVLGGVLFVLDVLLHVIHLHFLYVAPILFLASAGVLVAVSLATPRDPADKTEGLIWTPEIFRAESVALRGQPLWANYRVIAVVLLAVTALIVWEFR